MTKSGLADSYICMLCRYAYALSSINGVREVFSTSLYNSQLTQLMDYDNTMEILKHVFFAADRVVSMCQSLS